MYSINDIENVFDLVAYTVSAMKEVGYSDGEINDYLESTIKSNNNFNIVLLSKDRLNDCNLLFNKVDPTYNWFEDTWRDNYYSSLWDDDGRYDEDVNDYLASRNSYNIWDDDNAVEAYEGFDSCANRYWDCNDSTDD